MHQKFTLEALREIDRRIQGKAEKVLELDVVNILRRGNYPRCRLVYHTFCLHIGNTEDLYMDVENESLSSKLDRMENSIRAQKKELNKAKYYMPGMRQELANDYIDGFEVPRSQSQPFCDAFKKLQQIYSPSTSGNIQDNECYD